MLLDCLTKYKRRFNISMLRPSFCAGLYFDLNSMFFFVKLSLIIPHKVSMQKRYCIHSVSQNLGFSFVQDFVTRQKVVTFRRDNFEQLLVKDVQLECATSSFFDKFRTTVLLIKILSVKMELLSIQNDKLVKTADWC